MKRAPFVIALLGSVLAASAAPCQDNGWTVLTQDARTVISVRPPLPGGIAGQIWVHAEYTPPARLDGFRYASERYLAQVDCDNSRIVRLEWRLFARPGLTGRARLMLVNDGLPLLIVPGTVDEWVAEAACPKPPPHR